MIATFAHPAGASTVQRQWRSTQGLHEEPGGATGPYKFQGVGAQRPITWSRTRLLGQGQRGQGRQDNNQASAGGRDSHRHAPEGDAQFINPSPTSCPRSSRLTETSSLASNEAIYTFYWCHERPEEAVQRRPGPPGHERRINTGRLSSRGPAGHGSRPILPLAPQVWGTPR